MIYRNSRSWRADSIAKEMAKRTEAPFDLAAVESDRPCKLCGKVVAMRRRQRYCTACSMIPIHQRKKMMKG